MVRLCESVGEIWGKNHYETAINGTELIAHDGESLVLEDCVSHFHCSLLSQVHTWQH